MDIVRKIVEDERETLAHLQDEFKEKDMTQQELITELEALDDGEKLGPFTTEQIEAMLSQKQEATAFIESLQPGQAQLNEQWVPIKAFFDQGFVQGEDIWWNDQVYRSGYASAPVKAVYLCKRGSKAGIAVLMRDGSWRPKTVSQGSISLRLDD